ncbi:TlpA family protein disulfide reductase [Cupriavidus necator]|uniref:TlpA disulfide reductase family protein n=1 Tax=Cupriavidus necator TaxID=106590 RepID=UPI0014902AF8|nr:TlpA disulfide reductase family protein [Cupriavidus necator]NOV25596.1 TlpA family protein disulfide reductase [Cupriavidus necator]
MRAPAMLLRPLLAAGLVVAAAGAAALEVGDTVRLPDVRTLDGRTLNAAALAGKPLVVEYWATWCPFCALQNPRLQKLYDRTRGTPLQVLTISIDKDPREAADYMKQRGYTFPATMDAPALQAVFGKRKGLPELYVIDARGRVVQKEVGEMLEEDVAALERYAKP